MRVVVVSGKGLLDGIVSRNTNHWSRILDLRNKTTTEPTSVTVLVFYEEWIAQRVADAFKLAADLCRGKEPFWQVCQPIEGNRAA